MNKHIQYAVRAMFAMDKAEELKGLEVAPYKFGLFAEQDYKASNSMYWHVARDIITLQRVETKALQDQPKEGSLEANDNGVSNEREEERLDLLKKATLTLAILARANESLAERARKDSEKVGNKTEDGSRLRFNLNYGGKAFKPYHLDFDEFCVKMLEDAEPGSVWAMKIEAARSTVFPLVDATQAMNALPKLFSDDEVEELSIKAWDKLIESFAKFGQFMEMHNKDVAKYNALHTKDAAASKEFDRVCRQFNRDKRNCEYWVKRFMEPIALLSVTGMPNHVINTPYWRAEVAKAKAAEAEVATMEAEAKAAEAISKVNQIKATMALLDADELMSEAEAMLLMARAEMKARMKVRVKRAAEAVASAEPKAEPKAEVKSLMPNIIDSRRRAS